ncbi:hypothetical protein [Streptomyces pseudovenezuelae]|uniref:hypothetical protein n=1 Tax=Streptomyces pseudovenezuelae TaxID=67350 RepID=UPI0024740BB4|nr:hypothetical protein [Streptomyces pseudovenezuelae]
MCRSHPELHRVEIAPGSPERGLHYRNHPIVDPVAGPVVDLVAHPIRAPRSIRPTRLIHLIHLIHRIHLVRLIHSVHRLHGKPPSYVPVSR